MNLAKAKALVEAAVAAGEVPGAVAYAGDGTSARSTWYR